MGGVIVARHTAPARLRCGCCGCVVSAGDVMVSVETPAGELVTVCSECAPETGTP